MPAPNPDAGSRRLIRAAGFFIIHSPHLSFFSFPGHAPSHPYVGLSATRRILHQALWRALRHSGLPRPLCQADLPQPLHHCRTGRTVGPDTTHRARRQRQNADTRHPAEPARRLAPSALERPEELLRKQPVF